MGQENQSLAPGNVPTINGPTTVCVNSSNNVYITESGKTGYSWSISTGGTITSSPTSNPVTVTWLSAGPQSISVIYNGASGSTTLPVQVLDNLPAGVTITASDYNICAGTTVTFTATPFNGGTTPAYQWKVNNINVGTSSTTFSYSPTDGDVITCQLTSSETCVTGNPVISNAITMIVNPNLPVSVSISTTTNPSCSGVPVTFTATPTNGGITPIYQWLVNNAETGISNSTFTITPTDNQEISCKMTSNGSCISGNPATSNTIIMTVSPIQPVSVTVTTPTNPSCIGSPVVFTATPANGGTLPVYEWQVNGSVITGANNPVYSYIPATGDVVISTLTSNAGCTSGNPATSLPVTMTVQPPTPVTISIVASSNPVCNGNPVTFTATPVNGGTAPVFEWKVNGTSVGLSNSQYSYIPSNGDIVECILVSNSLCPNGNPAISNFITMMVSSSITPNVSITASSNPACQGSMVTFTAVPDNGGPAPIYQWKVNGAAIGTNSASYSYIPQNGEIVTCTMTSSSSCNPGVNANSNPITMTVSSSLPVSVSITALANPICQGSTASFTATPINGGILPIYQWKVNGVISGTNSSSFSYNPNNGDIVTCVLTSSISCSIGSPATSNSVIMNVSANLPASVTITPSINPACAGQVITFTAVPVNGGANPSYQWKVNNINVGSAGSTYAYAPTNNDQISCVLTSSNSCATGSPALSNTVTMTINTYSTVSVTISASQNPSCQGNTVTYTATPVNGGTNPVYIWKVNGVVNGGNQPTFSYVPAAGDIITCSLTSSNVCSLSNPAISNSVTQNVQPISPATITISTSANPVCSGTVVNFTATATNGGTTPSFQWKINGTLAGANNATLSFTPLNGDVITCQLTSSFMCVTGNPVTSSPIIMTVSSQLFPTISIVPSSNPFCQGLPVTFTSSSAFGGSIPAYQWKVNGIDAGTGTTYNYFPVNGDFVTCQLTSSLSCTSGAVTSNFIYMSVNTNTPAGLTITPSTNPVCQGSPVTITAVPLNGGTTPSYQWKVNEFIAGTNSTVFTYFPVNNDVVTCMLTSNANCVSGSPFTSAPVTLSVTNSLPTAVTISTLTNPFCQGMTVTFTAGPSNGGSAPAYQWKVSGVNAGTNSTTFAYIPANGDIVTCSMTSNATCVGGPNPVTSNQIVMSSATALLGGITIAASRNPVCQGTSVTFSATPVNGGINPHYQWKVNGANAGTNNSVYTYIPSNGDNITCELISSLTCVTNNPVISTSIVMTVTPPSPVSVSVTASINPICIGVQIILTATPVNGGTSPVYLWRLNGLPVGTNSNTFTYTPTNGDVITCQVTSNATCISGNPAISPPLVISVGTELPVGITIAASANPFCLGQNVTFTAIPTNGGTAPIYEWYLNGNPVGTNSPAYSYIPASGDVIKCQVTSNQACICNNPAMSNSITMVVGTGLPVSITVTESSNPLCAGSMVIFTANAVNGGISPLYQWRRNGVIQPGNNYTYQDFPSNGDVYTCTLTSSLGCATGNPATSNTITMTVYPSAPVLITISASANPSCQGSTVAYTAVPVNGGTLPVYQWKVNGTNAGTNSPSYSYYPVNNDVVTCRLTSNAICRTGNPATSPPITMTVNQYLPVSVLISASANPICQDVPVTYTATLTNGGTSPVFQWKVNGTNVGNNSATFTYSPLNNDVVTCQLTSSETCVSLSTVTSNLITMNVSPYLPVGISIAASANPICQGVPVTLTATPSNGGTIPVYQWTINGSNVGSNQSSYTYVPGNGDNVICHLTSNGTCTLGNPATSSPIILSVNQNLPVSVTIVSSANFVCQGQQITYTATPVNGGSTPHYQWIVNGMNVGNNNPVYSYFPTNGDIVSCQLTSGINCVTGSPAQSNQVTMVLYPYLPAGISITCTGNPSCQGTPVTYTATPINEGTSPVYHWKVNGAVVGVNSPVFTYTPTNNDVVTCELISNVPCALNNPVTSNSITMAVLLPQTTGVSITANNNPACQGTPVTFTATTSNGGSSPGYQWKVNGTNMGPNAATYTFAPSNGDVITCQLTSSVTCISNNPVLSNAITMVVSTDFPASITIIPSANPVCQGQQVTFTATGVNGGTNPFYQWLVNGIHVGVNSTTYTYTPSPGNTVQCQMTSGYTCASNNPAMSNLVTMSVNPIVPVSVSITASSNPACLGMPVTFTANPVNGGGNPFYQWKVNGVNVGVNQSTYTYTPANGNLITCQVTSNASCISNNPANSNPISMIIGSSFPVSIHVDVSSNPICEGTPVTFTATPTYGGSAPFYQWKKNGNPVGVNSPVFNDSPSNNDVITCTLTSNLTCGSGNPATSNAVTMLVLPIPVGITISCNPSGPVCAGVPVTFFANPQNGGPFPSYMWKVNGVSAGMNSVSFSYLPADGDVVSCMITSNATCASGNTALSNEISMTVHPLMPVSISITADPAGNICSNTTVTYTASINNGGSSPLYEWKVNGLTVGTNTNSYTYNPSQGDVVTCTLTSDVTCGTGNPAVSNSIIMIVLPVPVSITITATPATAVCQGSPVVFSANPVNGGPSPTYYWKVNGVVTPPDNPVFSYVPSNGDVVNCTLSSNATCAVGNMATSNSITVPVNPNLPVSLFVTANPGTDLCDGIPVTLNALPVNEGPNSVYQWKINNIPVGTNTNTHSFIPTNGDMITCMLTSDAVCATGNPAISNTLAMNVTPNLPVSITISPAPGNDVCEGTSVTYTATALNSGSSPVYKWKVNGINAGTNSPSFTYTPANGDDVNCILQSSLICIAGSPAVSNHISMAVHPNLPVTVSITANPTGPVFTGTLVTYTANPLNGGSNPVYRWKVNNIDVGTNLPVFSYTPVDGDLVTCEMTSNAICPAGNPAASNVIRMVVNPYLPVAVSIVSTLSGPVCTGSTVTFTATPVNGGTNPVYQWKVDGNNVGTNSSTYSFVPSNGDVVICILNSSETFTVGNPASSNSIGIAVIPYVSAGISISNNPSVPVCTGSNVTFTATPVNGGTSPVYQWKVNGLPTGLNNPTFTYQPVNGDIVICSVNSNAMCITGNQALSNSLNESVLPANPVSVAIAANPPGGFCEGTPVTCTAVPTNPGTTPVYQWTVNGVVTGTNSPVLSYTPVNNDRIQCVLTSDVSCPVNNPAASTNLSMNVYSNPSVSLNMCILQTTRNAKPIKLRGGLPLYGTWSGSGVSAGYFTPGLIPPVQNSATITFSATNSHGCQAFATQVIQVAPVQPFVCGNNLLDIRDNKSYSTVQIGTQCWFRQNLNYGQFITSGTLQKDNCLAEKYCYGDNITNCSLLGGIYQWDEMMQYNEEVAGQGLCPPGWHVPDENDWDLLFAVYNGKDKAGEFLKSSAPCFFNAQLSGILYLGSSWSFLDFSGFLWSSSIPDPLHGAAHAFNSFDKSVSDYHGSRLNSISVRCIKD